MKSSRILVVEDEKDVSDLMLLHLGREGYEAVAVDNGEEALRVQARGKFDMLVLDWMLPGLSGLDVCKQLKGKLPILMVTARADSADIVVGLEMGADDYVTKPFDIPVFLARVRALLRRAEAGIETRNPESLIVGGLHMDLKAHKVACNGQEIQLTLSEFKLLRALIENQGRVLSRDKLIELVQGEGVAVVDRAIDTHVFGLRKKLGDCSEVIETIRGVGYRVKPV